VYDPLHHWGRTPCHPGPLYQAVSEEGPKKLSKTPATQATGCSLCYRTSILPVYSHAIFTCYLYLLFTVSLFHFLKCYFTLTLSYL
jgi:hypothetical protein